MTAADQKTPAAKGVEQEFESKAALLWELTQKCEAAKKETGELEIRKGELTKKVERLEEQISRLKAAFAAEKKALKAAQDEAAAAHEERKKQVDVELEKLVAVKTEVKNREEASKNTEKVLEERAQHLDRIEKKLEGREEIVDKHAAHVQTIEGSALTERENNKDLQDKLEKWEYGLKGRENELTSRQAALEKTQQVLKDIEKEAQEDQRKAQHLSIKTEAERKRVAALLDKLEERKADYIRYYNLAKGVVRQLVELSNEERKDRIFELLQQTFPGNVLNATEETEPEPDTPEPPGEASPQ